MIFIDVTFILLLLKMLTVGIFYISLVGTMTPASWSSPLSLPDRLCNLPGSGLHSSSSLPHLRRNFLHTGLPTSTTFHTTIVLE